MPSDQAESQAEVLTEAFNVSLESLVTKDYLAVRMAEQQAFLDTRFAEQDARIDKLFAEQDARIDKRFAKQDAKFEKRFAEQDTKFDSRFSQFEARLAELKVGSDGKFRTLYVMFSIMMAAVILPYLERLLAL